MKELANDNMRMGHGYDLHRLVEDSTAGAGVVLAGITIPCQLRLVAHSDGDVVTHALIDAIFGALALGDLGDHFPDTDETWRGVRSTEMLAEVFQKHLRARWRVVNADLTLIAEVPRIGAYRQSMRACLADVLQTDHQRMSIKATTNEGQDSIGRKQAIACHAVLLLSKQDK